jgi:hypothetical protein
MTELEAITARHSVRHYIDKPIEAEKIEAIRECIGHCNREGGVHFQLVTDEPKAFRNGVDWPKYGRFEGVNNYVAIVAPKGKVGGVTNL